MLAVITVTKIVFLLCICKSIVISQKTECDTPDGRTGQCTPIKDCPSLFSMLTDSMTNSTISYLQKSRCKGWKSKTNPNICCPVTLESRSPQECETPDGKPGQCTPIEDCSSLYSMLTDSMTNSTISYLQKSRCKSRKSKTNPDVCCPDKLSSQSPNQCQTPDHETGHCKPITECLSLLTLLGNLTDNTVTYLRQSSCEKSENASVPSFCCPPELQNIDVSTKNLQEIESDVCGLIVIKDKITAGTLADIDEFPWNAILKYQIPFLLTLEEPQEFYCGGALISDRHVLTAAHCISGPRIPQYTKLKTVRFGEHDVTNEQDCISIAGRVECANPPFEIPVKKTFVHEDYNPNDPAQRHDIAVVELKTKVTYNDFVRPICLLPKTNKTKSEISNFLEAGWGISNNTYKNSIKSKTEVKFRDNKICENVFKIKVGDGQFCGEPRKQSVGGCADNGGVLMYLSLFQATIAGVLSLTLCNTTVYTDVSQYVDWISDKMQSS